MKHRSVLAAFAFAGFLNGVANAQTVRPPSSPHVLRAVVPLAAPRARSTPYAYVRAAHIVFGTIVRISAASFVLRRRNGGTILVDDSAALRDGTYAAPLFVGKAVAVEGRTGNDGTLFAARISRAARLDATTAVDR